MKSETRKVTTGRGSEDKREIEYTFEYPEDLNEAIDVEGGADTVYEMYLKSKRIEADNAARQQLAPKSTVVNVPDNIENARGKLGSLLFKIGKAAAAEYLGYAREKFPDFDEGVSPEFLQMCGVSE